MRRPTGDAHRRRRRSARNGVLSLLVIGGALRAPIGFAAVADPDSSKPPVHVEWRGCEVGASNEIAAILRVELLNRIESGARPDAYRTTVECAADLITITVGAPGGSTKALQANLARTPANVRARIVALALAELVRDLDREPAGSGAAATAPPAPLSPISVPPSIAAPDSTRDRVDVVAHPTRERVARIGIGALGQASTFGLNGVWLGGGGLELEVALHGWCFGLDGVVLTTSERFDPGTAQAFLGYGSPYLAWLVRWGRAQLRLGAGYALGAATISGHATDARAFGGTTAGPWTAPYGLASLSLEIAPGVALGARARAGWVTTPVTGDVAGGADVALDGLWLSVEAAVTIRL